MSLYSPYLLLILLLSLVCFPSLCLSETDSSDPAAESEDAEPEAALSVSEMPRVHLWVEHFLTSDDAQTLSDLVVGATPSPDSPSVACLGLADLASSTPDFPLEVLFETRQRALETVQHMTKEAYEIQLTQLVKRVPQSVGDPSSVPVSVGLKAGQCAAPALEFDEFRSDNTKQPYSAIVFLSQYEDPNFDLVGSDSVQGSIIAKPASGLLILFTSDLEYSYGLGRIQQYSATAYELTMRFTTDAAKAENITLESLKKYWNQAETDKQTDNKDKANGSEDCELEKLVPGSVESHPADQAASSTVPSSPVIPPPVSSSAPVPSPAPRYNPGFSARPDSEFLFNQTLHQWWKRADGIADLNKLLLGDRIVRVMARNRKFGIFYLREFLSPRECDLLIADSLKHIQRSTVVDNLSGRSVVDAQRTSKTAYYQWNQTELINTIEERLTLLSGIPRYHGEPMQLQYYGEGGLYNPHHDFFSPEISGSQTHLNHGGQRLLTIIVYLSEVEAGGATIFPDHGFEFVPERGSAVMFPSVDRQGRLERKSLHGGMPVLIGSKWIITRWIRAEDMSVPPYRPPAVPEQAPQTQESATEQTPQ